MCECGRGVLRGQLFQYTLDVSDIHSLVKGFYTCSCSLQLISAAVDKRIRLRWYTRVYARRTCAPHAHAALARRARAPLGGPDEPIMAWKGFVPERSTAHVCAGVCLSVCVRARMWVHLLCALGCREIKQQKARWRICPVSADSQHAITRIAQGK
jgi:hypothetical protein